MTQELVFKNGPWNSFFEGQSGEHSVQLLFDGQSDLLSLVWDITENQAVGLVLENLRVFVCNKNPGALVEKADFDCIQIAKKEAGTAYWFVVIHSLPTYVTFSQEKLDAEMDRSQIDLRENELRFKALARAMGVETQKLQEVPNFKTVFFSTPLIHELLFQKTVQEKTKMEQPHAFSNTSVVLQGEFLVGLDTQKQLVKEPLGLFRRTLIVDGQKQDRIRAMHVFIESALLSTVPVVVFDSDDYFDGLAQASQNRDALEHSKIALEPVGFPTTAFLTPQKVRVNLAVVDIDAVLELFRVGKNPAIQLVQGILSQNRASNLSQVIEIIQTQTPLGATSTYQLKKATRILTLIENAYPGFFDGANNVAEISKSWSSGLGRAGLIKLDGLDKRAKLILLHALVRELKQYYQNSGEQRPVKAFLFVPEANGLFSRHSERKIHQLLQADLSAASAVGVGSVLSCGHVIELNPKLVSDIQTQISIVNQDDIGIRIENRKPYRAILRPPLSQFKNHIIETLA